MENIINPRWKPEQYLTQIREGQWVWGGHPPAGIHDGLAGGAEEGCRGYTGGGH